jgi:glycosyltransferase involved in cell wall biosynthesis
VPGAMISPTERGQSVRNQRAVHIIGGLGKGGAETTLYNTLKHTPGKFKHWDVRVLTLGFGDDFFADPIRELGVPVDSLDVFRHPLTTARTTRRFLRHSDVAISWMYHANLYTWLLTRLQHGPRLVWCIRHADLSKANNKWTTRMEARIGALVSKSIQTITYNGQQSLDAHTRIGYPHRNAIVLPNGCDTDVYSPSPAARPALESEFPSIRGKTVLLSAARFHPIKDHDLFLKAISRLRQTDPAVVGIAVGNGVTPSNTTLTEAATRHGLRLGTDVFFLGERHDLPTLYAASDVYVLHSAGEAFPNTMLEAMSCGLPVASTNVGDSATITGTCRYLSPPRDTDGMVSTLRDLLSQEPATLEAIGKANRRRVQEFYSIQAVAERYGNVFYGSQDPNS